MLLNLYAHVTAVMRLYLSKTHDSMPEYRLVQNTCNIYIIEINITLVYIAILWENCLLGSKYTSEGRKSY